MSALARARKESPKWPRDAKGRWLSDALTKSVVKPIPKPIVKASMMKKAPSAKMLEAREAILRLRRNTGEGKC